MINTSAPVTLYSNISTFRETNKSFKLDGDLLKTMLNFNFNVDHSNPPDQKLIYEFAKGMKFDNKQKGRPNNRKKTVIKLLNSPAIMAFIISTIFLPEKPNELSDGLKLLLQEEQPGIKSGSINEEIIVMVYKLLEYKCISKEQPECLLLECSN